MLRFFLKFQFASYISFIRFWHFYLSLAYKEGFVYFLINLYSQMKVFHRYCISSICDKLHESHIGVVQIILRGLSRDRK